MKLATAFVLFFILSLNLLFGQENPSDSIPRYKDGINGFYDYLSKELKTPKKAFDAQEDVKVYISFIVDTNGMVKDVKSVIPAGYGCDEEGIRVIETSSGDWLSAELGGKKVEASMLIPIKFSFKTKIYTASGPISNDGQLIEVFNGATANLFYEKGVEEHNKGNSIEALKYFYKTVEYKPCDIDAWFNIAFIQNQFGEKEKACYALKRGRGCGDMEAAKLYKENCKDKE